MPNGATLDRDGRNLLSLTGAGLALAAWTHLLGNTRGQADLPHVALLAAVAVVLARPRHPLGLVALSLAALWTAWDEAPVLSNHWTLMGFVAVALLAVVAVAAASAGRAGGSERRDLVELRLVTWFLPTARWCVLAFYLFASFHKLNSAFFDPAVSCAVVFLDESLTSLGLGGLGVQDASAVRWAVIIGTSLVELAIPWLLMIRRTRIVGVVVAVAFHAVLALDRSHQIVDFSSFLTVFYLTFLPAAFATRVVEGGGDRVRAVGARLGVRPAVLRSVGVAAVVLTGLAAEADIPSRSASRSLVWWVWQPAVVVLLVVLVRCARRQPDGPATALGRPPAWLWALPALALLNGVLPYVEVRTAGSWNMYANLRVVEGDSNHLVIRRGVPLTDEHLDLVEILGSSDPALDEYATEGLAVTRTQLRVYVADHPDVALRYRYHGRVVDTPRAGDDPLLDEPVSVLREKLQVFRAVSIEQPQACLPTWGAAN